MVKSLNINELQNTLEAVLFAAGEPIEIERLSQGLEIEVETLVDVLDNMSAKLDETGGGLCVLKLDNKYQMCARKEYAESIRAVMDIKRNAPLSQAAFEVLAVIAYNQPVTKSFVEQVRGVDCTGVIGTLCQKSLIEEKGRLELPGRPLIYGTTPAFLRTFCLSSLEDLPAISPGEQVSFAEAASEVAEENGEKSDSDETAEAIQDEATAEAESDNDN